MEGLDQGTVLSGLRSDKYPGISCYGIVITASCDISNDKVAKLYFLIGVDAKRWFRTEYAYHQVYDAKIKQLVKPVENLCRQFSLDADAVRSFTLDEVRAVINTNLEQETDRERFERRYQDYAAYCRPGMDDEARGQAIRQDTKPAVTFLKEIGKERILHFFYLPKAAYLKNSNQTDDGLIIDLQEIGAISMRDAQQITGPGIDNLILIGENEKECIRLRSQYWLEEDEDFVGIEGEVISPWREHLMQRFMRDFARIGLNGATVQDYETLVKQI